MKKKIWLPEYMLAFVASEAHRKGMLVEHVLRDILGDKRLDQMSNDELVLLVRDHMNGDKHDGHLIVEVDDR